MNGYAIDTFHFGLIERRCKTNGNHGVSCRFSLQSIVTRAPLTFFWVLRGSYPTVAVDVETPRKCLV